MTHGAAATGTRRLVAVVILVATVLWTGVLAAQAANRFLTRVDPLTGVTGVIGDYQHFYYAAAAMTRGENPYQQHVRQYGYLPMWAMLQVPLVPLGPAGAGAMFAALNYIMLLVGMWFMSGEVLRRVPTFCSSEGEHSERTAAAQLKPPTVAVDLLVRAVVVALGALVMSDKVRAEFRLGQTDVTIMLCFALSLVWLEKRPLLAGLLLGMIAQFKFQSLVMIPYFVLRRRWAALASTIASCVGFAVVGSIFWGWERNTQYLKIALGSVGELLGATKEIADSPALHPMTWERSVSVPSLAARLAHVCGWNQGMAAALATVMLSFAATALAWWMYVARGQSLFKGRMGSVDDATPRGRLLVLLEWCGLIMGALAFSPQTTVRHLYLMMLVVMVGLALVLIATRGASRIMLGVVLAVFWGAMVFPPGGVFSVESPARQAAGAVAMGASVLLFFVVLWLGLGLAQRMDREPAISPRI
jgi:hypothetical protein